MKLNIDIKFDNNGRIVPFMNGREITMIDSPFVVFLATAGMCSAVFVKAFIQQRGLSLDGLVITQIMDYDQRTNHVSEILIDLKLPAGFPEKYTNAIKKVVNQCPVKQHLLNPPTFEVVTNLDRVAAN
ncbi:MAG: OsmC family protein [Urechidicola sp.]|nr:OsmC family protein [Urechidicola sp.]